MQTVIDILRPFLKGLFAALLAFSLSAWGPWVLERAMDNADDGSADTHETDANMEAPDEGSC